MTDQGIGSWIERRARVAPERIALVSGSESWTNEALAGRIRRLAHGLVSLGVRHGDRVCWVGANHPAFLETLFATAKLGAILAPVNHRLEPAEIQSVVADVAPRVVVLDSSPAATSIRSHGPARVLVAGSASDAISFEDLVASSADAPLDVPVSLSDLCMIPHTSGTEGRPKGVMLTHGNVTWNAVNVLTSTDLRPDDITIAIAPFFRVGGTGVNVLPVVLRGGTVIIPRSAPDPEDLLSLMSRHRVTVGFANPDLLEALTRARSWPTCDLTSLRYVITGGAPVPERLLQGVPR